MSLTRIYVTILVLPNTKEKMIKNSLLFNYNGKSCFNTTQNLQGKYTMKTYNNKNKLTKLIKDI